MQAVSGAAVPPRQNIPSHPVAQARLVAYAFHQSVSQTVEDPLSGQCGRQRCEIEGKLIASAHPAFFAHSCVRLSRPTRDLAIGLAMLMLGGDRIGPAQLDAQLSRLMMAVIDAFSDWRNLNVKPHAPDARIRRAIACMRANVGKDLDMASLAAEACLSRAHFFRLFQQCTSLTPSVAARRSGDRRPDAEPAIDGQPVGRARLQRP
jgi:AraC-like DNA-binding protein